MKKIRYPAPLELGSLIGITAPSSGAGPEFYPRLDFSISGLRELGYRVLEGKCLRQDIKSVSGAAKERADDFHSLWLNPEVKAIIPPWGGQFLMEILPLLNVDLIQSTQPKWILGYSDISSLLYFLTSHLGIATAHGPNLMDIAPVQQDSLTQNWQKLFKLKEGAEFLQKSSEKHLEKWGDYRTDPQWSFELTADTNWKVLGGKDSVKMSGRLLGGCLETLATLAPTRFAGAEEFLARTQTDPVLVYLESAGSELGTVKRLLWSLREAGWFKGASGILLGRFPKQEASELTYAEVIEDVLGSLSIPVVYDVDIGHVPPQMTLVNGAWAEVVVEKGRGSVVQKLI